MLIDGVFYSAEFDINDDSVSFKDAAGTVLLTFTSHLSVEDADGETLGRLQHANGGWHFDRNGVRLDLQVADATLHWKGIERAELKLFTHYLNCGKTFS